MAQEHVDLISNLPQDILQRINSFLPLKEAVRTSLLSTQWRSLWSPTMVNHFAADGPTAAVNAVKDSLEAVSVLLGSYNSPDVRKPCFWLPEGDVTVVATKGVDKELHLNFSHSLKDDKFYYQMKMELGDTTPPINITNLSTLRTLHLRSVASVTEDFASSLLTNCQLLQSLKIEKCEGLKRVGIEKNESLRSLMIADCLDIENVTVSASGLRSFLYKGLLTHIHMKNALNLVDVVLDLEGAFGNSDFDCEEVLSALFLERS